MYTSPYHTEDLSKYSFLISGGAGFIGSNIVEYLLKYGAKLVRVLDNFSTGSINNINEYRNNPAFELMEGDIRDLETCRRALEGIDYVSHQAALGSVPRSINDPILTNEVNVNGFLNILVAARDARVKRMVYAASSSTYGDHPRLPKIEDEIGSPLSPYAVTKYVNELYASVFSKTYKLHTIGLRYFNVFGPRQNPKGPYAAVIPLFIEAALMNKAASINGDGETSRDFTFVENAVQANIKSFFAKDIDKHEVINVALGMQTTLNQLWNKICNLSGASLNPLYIEERKGDIKYSLADINKAKALVDYHPKFIIDDGLEITYEWYRRSILEILPK
jgi:UDP-N-acetylglucosamine 4-epimerase